MCVFCVSGVALATDRDLSQDRAQQGNVRLGRVQQRTVEQLAVLVRAGLMEEIVAEANGFDEVAVFSRESRSISPPCHRTAALHHETGCNENSSGQTRIMKYSVLLESNGGRMGQRGDKSDGKPCSPGSRCIPQQPQQPQQQPQVSARA